MFEVGAEVVLLAVSHWREFAMKWFGLITVVKVIFRVDGSMPDHSEEG